jgi:hypothetical protein
VINLLSAVSNQSNSPEKNFRNCGSLRHSSAERPRSLSRSGVTASKTGSGSGVGLVVNRVQS